MRGEELDDLRGLLGDGHQRHVVGAQQVGDHAAGGGELADVVDGAEVRGELGEALRPGAGGAAAGDAHAHLEAVGGGVRGRPGCSSGHGGAGRASA